jgi:hypothetical protein
MPDERDWTLIVKSTLAAYQGAYGDREGLQRLRPHLRGWPRPALRTLARLRQERGRP